MALSAHRHPVSLQRAHANHPSVVHLFVFAPCWFGRTSFGLLKTGHHRARFLLESVADLRASLEKLGSTLVVRSGDPAEIIASLAGASKATTVYTVAETCSEELAVEREVQRQLVDKSATLQSCWGGRTLYDFEDLPFSLSGEGAAGVPGAKGKKSPFPQIYTQFRKTVESTCAIRPTTSTSFDRPQGGSCCTEEAGMAPALEAPPHITTRSEFSFPSCSRPHYLFRPFLISRPYAFRAPPLSWEQPRTQDWAGFHPSRRWACRPWNVTTTTSRSPLTLPEEVLTSRIAFHLAVARHPFPPTTQKR